jgi:hypothetical protein
MEQGVVATEVKDIVPEAVVDKEPEKSILAQHPYLLEPFVHFKDLEPLVYKPELEKMNDRSAVHTPVEVPEVERPGDYLDEPLFVQNEEQKSSGLWTSTLISKEEYVEAASNAIPDLYNDAPDPTVAEFIALIKAGKMMLQDVPEEYLLAVKARM